MDRGVCTFASKALKADAAGAAAAVIVQTHDVWPYMMEDSKGEAKTAGGLGIPVCMVSKEKGAWGFVTGMAGAVRFLKIGLSCLAGLRRNVLSGKMRHGEAQSAAMV